MKMQEEKFDWSNIHRKNGLACSVIANNLLKSATYTKNNKISLEEFIKTLKNYNVYENPYELRYVFDTYEIYGIIRKRSSDFEVKTLGIIRMLIMNGFSHRKDAELRSVKQAFSLLQEFAEDRNIVM